jgi:hypothetical protein
MANKAAQKGMHWSDWESTRNRLKIFGEAIQGPSPYQVVITDKNPNMPYAGVNYNHKTLTVNPKAFPTLPVKEQYTMTKALMAHEAGHRRYSSRPTQGKNPGLAQITNALEDERIERKMRQNFVGIRPLLNKACHVMYDQVDPMDPSVDNPTEALRGLLQLRWAARVRQPLKGSLSAKNYNLFFDLLPLAKEAWDAPNTAAVEAIAQQIYDKLGIPPNEPPPPDPSGQMGQETGQRSQSDQAEGEPEPSQAPPQGGGSAQAKPDKQPKPKPEKPEEPEAPKGAEGDEGKGNEEKQDEKEPAPGDQPEPEKDDEADTGNDEQEPEQDKDDSKDPVPDEDQADGPNDPKQTQNGEPQPEPPPSIVIVTEDDGSKDEGEKDPDAIVTINGIHPGMPQDTEFPISPKPYLDIEQEIMPGAIELFEELQLQEIAGRMDSAQRGPRFNMREYIRNPTTPFQDETEPRRAPRLRARMVVDYSGSMEAHRSKEYENYGSHANDSDRGLTRIEYAVRAAMMLHVFAVMAECEHVITLTPNDNRLADLHSGEMGKAMLAGAIPAQAGWDDMGVTMRNHLNELIDEGNSNDIKVIFGIHDGMTNNPDLAKSVCEQARRENVLILGIGLALDEECARHMADVFGQDHLVLCKDPRDLPEKLTNLLRGIYGF